MLPRLRRIFARILRAGWPVPLLLLIPVHSMGQLPAGVVCLEGVSKSERARLAHALQEVTGWPNVKFDRNGRLNAEMIQSVGGSARARSLLTKAMSGTRTIVVEDANHNADVVFGSALPANWKGQSSNGSSVYVIQIDFADFEYITGDRKALQAFNVGWVALHEIDHIVNDSLDADRAGKIGDCEEHINLMRRECDLPERADYFSTFLPVSTDSLFAKRFVRLAFEKDLNGDKKKYWLVWDAALVGGL